MKISLFVLIGLSATCFAQDKFGGGDGGGSGGNGTEDRVLEAHEFALDRLGSLQDEQIEALEISEEAKHLLYRRSQPGGLGERLQELKTLIEVKPEVYAFRPHLGRNARVEASFRHDDGFIEWDSGFCDGLSQERLAERWIHESVHALGYLVSEGELEEATKHEDFAKLVARAVMASDLILTEVGFDPFSVTSCGSEGSLKDRVSHCRRMNGSYAERITRSLYPDSDARDIAFHYPEHVFTMVSTYAGGKGTIWWDRSQNSLWRMLGHAESQDRARADCSEFGNSEGLVPFPAGYLPTIRQVANLHGRGGSRIFPMLDSDEFFWIRDAKGKGHSPNPPGETLTPEGQAEVLCVVELE